jgi:hypothetical protein
MSEIVESLFGVSPERYRQQQDVALQREALAYAQLNPMQRAEAGIYAGARQLGSGIGRMLGGEDPGMRRVTEQDQIIRSINLNDPETFGPAAQRALQTGHSELAQKIMNRYSQLQESSALIGQRKAAAVASLAQATRERTQPTAKEIQIASEYASTFGEQGSQEYIDAYRSALRGEEKKDKPVVVGNALVNPNTGVVIYQSPNETLKTAVVGGNLVDTATGRVIFTAPETQVKPIVVDNKLINPVDGTVIYESPSKKLNTAVVSGNLVDVDTGAVIFSAPDKVAPEPTTVDLTNARAIAALAGPVGSPEYNAAFNTEYKRLTAEKESKETKTEIQKLQEYAATLKRGSPEFAQVQAKIKALGETGGTKVEVKNVMPGDKNLADIPAFRASVQRTIDSQLKTITATEQALTAIDDSLATSNFAAYRAAQVQFARAISGAGDLSQRELKAAGADPSLLGGTADYLSTVFSSTPTADTQKKIRSTLLAIQTVARRQAQGEVNQQKAMALRSPGYNPDAVSEALKFPQLQAEAAPAAARAPIYAVNPNTKARIMSTDGGSTWSPVR